MSKKIIVAILIIVLIGAGAAYAFLGGGEEQLSTVKAEKGNITEQVSVTGSLVPLKRIKLEPKTKGQVQNVLVDISDKVEKGDLLLKLDQTQAQIQVQKSKSNLESTKEEINLLETKLKNAERDLELTKKSTEQSVEEAQTNLKAKQQNLEDTRETEENQLKEAYEDGRSSLDSNYLTANKARIELDNIKDDYFNGNDQISLKVKDKLDQAESTLKEAKNLIDEANSSEDQDTTKTALNRLKEGLKELKEALRYTRDDACEDARYEYEVSSSDKTTLDTQKSNVETAISNITTAQQELTAQEISSRKNINTAQSQLDSAKAALEQAKSQRDQKINQAESKVEETEQELKLKKIKLESVEADLSQAQQNLKDTTINAPFAGTITKVNIEEGETANIGTVVVTMIPKKDYKIEADVSEVNIASLEKSDPVKVDFDALPDEQYQGEVSKVHPAETVKEGIIYYRVEVMLESYPDKLKPGFTVNLDIITGQKENVVTLPYIAVKEDNEGSYVTIANEEQEKRRVSVGLEGDTKVEIKEGLKEGEEVILTQQ